MSNQCNKCGKTDVHTEEIFVNFNYVSKFDMEKWNLSLCDDCLKELAIQCVHKPEGYGVTGFEDYWTAMKEDYGQTVGTNGLK